MFERFHRLKDKKSTREPKKALGESTVLELVHVVCTKSGDPWVDKGRRYARLCVRVHRNCSGTLSGSVNIVAIDQQEPMCYMHLASGLIFHLYPSAGDSTFLFNFVGNFIAT